GYPFRYDAFDVFYPLVFPLTKETLEVAYRQPDGTSAGATINTVTRETRTEILQQRYPEFPVTANDLWGLEILDGGIAILTLGDFSGAGAGALTLDPAIYFAKVFKELKEKDIQQLILDVRENEGGNDPIVAELFTYFPFKYRKEPDFEGRMRYDVFPESLKPIVKTWGDNPWYYNPKTDGYDAEKGAYIIADEFENNEKNKVKKNAFRGQVCVLTGRLNASLGFYLAKAVQDYKIGTLIGETTGGSLRGINGGQLLFIRLPNTNIELDMPVLGGFATTPQPAHGVVPALPVTITAADQLAGRDVVLAAALAFLAEQKK
ncbi:MAG: S41 family peptidase, partial [Bacteroidota bacterium]